MGLQMINCVDEFFFNEIAVIYTQFSPNFNTNHWSGGLVV